MNFYTKILHCRLCSSSSLKDVFDLGAQCLTGVFKPPGVDVSRSPLCLVRCETCNLLQLSGYVDPRTLYSSYFYESGINRTMRRHLKSVFSELVEIVNLKADDLILDIGCNDGTLLECFPDYVDLLGVDPNNIARRVKNPRIKVVNDFFSFEAVRDVLGGKKARVVTSLSMFYDLNNPNEFIEDVNQVLAEDGVWVVEMNYTGDMLLKLGFDMLSHEHVTYYTVETMQKLLSRHNLFINQLMFNSINGGSVRFYISKSNVSNDSVINALSFEEKHSLNDEDTLRRFGQSIMRFRSLFGSYLKGLHQSGIRIWGYGASTRGNTILQIADLDSTVIDGVSEKNPRKHGLVTPGTAIPIVSEELSRLAKPDYYLVLPYSFKSEFVEREREFLEDGGVMIFPLPVLTEVRMIDGVLHERQITDYL